MDKKDDIVTTLKKRAKGFYYTEKSEEYVDVDGQMKLIKRKVNRKYQPPDVAAIKATLESDVEIGKLTDDELWAMREKIIQLADNE